MVFVADDLAAWLVGALADAGSKRLITWVLGSEQQRALRQAATAAVEFTAAEFCPDGGKRAQELAMVVSQVFRVPVPGASMTGQETLLEALQAEIARQLAPSDDAGLTGARQSWADVVALSAGTLAEILTGYLVREIVVRGARGGPLAPLAAQLNHDMTHLQGQRIEGKVDRLDGKLLEVLARLADTHAVPSAPTALSQLPPEVRGFTGRDAELAVLAGLLDPDATAGPVAVSAVAGLAGVGKTTLAVEAGHAAVQHGWFGGGVLFIDLHGYDEAPVKPSQALDALLRALGVPAEHIPPGVEERAGLYRSVLAQVTDPVLVIADNASSEAQVQPLLPGTGPHKVLVTSRHTLAGLGARLVDVMVLDGEASVDLLDDALRAARPEDDRISGEREAAGRLAGLCGGLPLALQIVAALLKADPALTVYELTEELAAESERLDQLAYDDGSGPGAPSVTAAFELSYRRLEDIPALVFRLLPVNPGPDVSTAAAGVLADLPVREVRKVLAGLARAHLAEAAPGRAGRWRMHDLLRLYAGRLSDDHAEADGREQARDRLLGWYLRMADAAHEHLRALPGTPVPADFTGRDGALEWLDAERASLIAAVTMAADTGRDQIAMRLPLNLVGYLSWRRRFDDWIAITAISLDAARRLGDRSNEGSALGNLGNALQQARRFEEAITAHQGAAVIYREIGDRHVEGIALSNLGIALAQVRRFEEAITACQEAAAIFRETGDRRGEGMALGNLGAALKEVGRLEEAITAHQEDLVICRETGDRHAEGMALNNLGLALEEAGRFEEAITACQAAAIIYRETGDRHGEGTALTNLGNALQDAGRLEEAITAHQEDLVICRETGDRHGEGTALTNLGNALWDAGRFEEAITAHQAAAVIYRETGDRHGEGTALNNLGLDLRELRRFEEAITACQEAAAIFRETGDRRGEDMALGNLETARAAQKA
jgi:tetratricopeptide (TPR) repeat protein